MYIFSYDRRTDVSAQNIDLSGNLDVSGSSTLSTLSVSGLATFSGGISAEGLSVADTTGNITIQNTDPSIIVKTSSNGAGKIIFGNTSHGVGRGVNISTLTDSNDVVLHTTGSGSVGLVTSGIERMRINNTGNVGIGTTTPASKLDVNGNVTLKAAATSSPVSHVPVFISDPASSAQTLVTRLPADFRVQIGALDQVNLGFENGSTAGPTITNSGGTNVVIPSATDGVSGVVTTGNQTFAGNKTFSGNTTTNGTLSVKAATTTSVPLAIPVFTSAPSSTAQQIVTRTPAQLLSDISGVSSLNNQTIAGTKTFSSTIVGSINGNAATVTNGVYNTGIQTIGGIKTFSSTIDGSINGNAVTVTNGVYTTGNQTIANTVTFSGTASINTLHTKAPDLSISESVFSIPVFVNNATNVAQTVKKRTPAQLLSDISGVGLTGDQTIAGAKTFTSDISFNGVINSNFPMIYLAMEVYTLSISGISSWIRNVTIKTLNINKGNLVFLSNTNGYYRVQISGYYFFNCNLRVDSPNNEYIEIQWYKVLVNGSTTQYETLEMWAPTGDSNNRRCITSSTLIYLNALEGIMPATDYVGSISINNMIFSGFKIS